VPAELLGLAAPGVGDEEGAVVAGEGVPDLLLGGLVDVLLEVGHERLGIAVAVAGWGGGGQRRRRLGPGSMGL
jgi:hypothetical protein